MEKVLLIIVAASGLCVVSSHAPRAYYFVYELKNMTDARSYCRENHTDLATIHNMEDTEVLRSKVDMNKIVSSDYLAWIGLYDDVNSWRWSLSDTSFYHETEAEFRYWNPREPNNKNSGEHCGQMYNNGRWNDEKCDLRCPSICADVQGSNVTFVFINNSMTWTEAQSYCRANHTDLASVRNLLENQRVQELLGSTYSAWIGLFRDSWKWLDGSNSSFRYWQTGEPNNNQVELCVAASFSSGRWQDWNCDEKRAFICYDRPVFKKVLRVRLMGKNSSLNLNDPAVMEDISRQLKQKLTDRGVSGDFKLSWKTQPDGRSFHKEVETETNSTSKGDCPK
ncbi:macrophage mannose receptor 1-like [Toxotes jaculatrix]|uniref:macrophage mannose receptor 1-like n=1 Tax=Toxotes jaculatrix TaxID=941984 RepID=UPI001B3AA135|nr:macrophage mannose receptor 1-like [Toxotes jaculatrix]